MIRFLNRNQIDDERYNLCIANSPQSIMYAFSWYLDIVADDWGILLQENYQAVMPIPYMKALKYLRRKKILQPFFCQQLGVFSTEISREKETLFLKEFLRLKPKSYAFNSFNLITNLPTKPNYELHLNSSYQELRKNFRKDRKYRINQSLKANLQIEEVINPLKMIDIAKNNYNVKTYSIPFFRILSNTTKEVLQKNKGFLLHIVKENKVLGAGFFLHHSNRIIYVFSAYTKESKSLQAPSFLINYVIKKYANTQTILDFEGSSIPTIADFFKSFGSKKNQYPYL